VTEKEQVLREKRIIILEMIEASWSLAERLGEHPLRRGCNCISCVNRRKRMLDDRKWEGKFEL
jgi:hypothetical protein